MTEADTDAVALLWYRSGKAAYDYLPGWLTMTPEVALSAFRNHIAARCDVYVVSSNDTITGYLAMKQSYLDRLYVDPAHQRRGFGSALLEHARTMSPAGIELHTHQQNAAARAFYEHHGFVAVRYGTSPPPESAPDVEYHWRP